MMMHEGGIVAPSSHPSLPSITHEPRGLAVNPGCHGIICEDLVTTLSNKCRFAHAPTLCIVCECINPVFADTPISGHRRRGDTRGSG